jgi:hypothetical protein
MSDALIYGQKNYSTGRAAGTSNVLRSKEASPPAGNSFSTTTAARPTRPPVQPPWTAFVTAQEPRIDNTRTRDHWAIVFEPECDVHQLTGYRGSYYYIPRGSKGKKILESQSLIAKVAVGTLPPRAKFKVDDVLKPIPIVNEGDDQAWACQDWIVDALAALNAAGYDIQALSHVELTARLRAAETRPRRAGVP